MAEIDKALVKEILAAKSPRHFAFIAGGDKDVLLMSKTTIGQETVNEVKDAVGGKDFRGKAVLEDVPERGETLVFLMTNPPKNLLPKLRRTIKLSTGLRRPIELRKITRVQDDQTGDRIEQHRQIVGDGTVSPKRQLREAQTADEYKKVYVRLHTELSEEVAELQNYNPKLAAKCLAKLGQVAGRVEGDLGNVQTFKAAAKSLLKLRDVMAKAPRKTTKAQKQTAMIAEYKAFREALGPAVERVRVMRPEAAAEAELLIAQANALTDGALEGEADYKAGLKILVKLRKKLVAVLGELQNLSREDANRSDEASDKAKDFIETLRAQKKELDEFDRLCPNHPRVRAIRQNLAQAAKHANDYQYSQALTLLAEADQNRKESLAEFKSYQTRLPAVQALIDRAHALRRPSLSREAVGRFRVLLLAAQNLARQFAFTDAERNLAELEDEIRAAVSDRERFAEACLETSRALGNSEDVLPENVFKALETRYLQALANYDRGQTDPAYDEVTKISAEIKVLLRDIEVKGTIQKGKEDLDHRKVKHHPRVLALQLNYDNLRRALTFVAEHDPENARILEQRLEDVRTAMTENFEKAEIAIEKLSKDLAELMTDLRSQLTPKQWAKAPIPETKAPQTLHEWKQDIERDGVLNRVKVGKNIGSGGFGGIFRLDPINENDRDNLPPLVVKLPEQGVGIEEMDKEAKLYEKVGDHPNLLKCLGVQEVEGKPGLVLERVQGKTMDVFSSRLKDQLIQGTISDSEYWGAIQYTVSNVMKALVHLHSKGVGHNDMKALNVMVDQVTGDVKLIDLGLLDRLGNVITGKDSMLYHSPETVSEQGTSPQTDSFGVGLSLFQSLSEKVNPLFDFNDPQNANSGSMTDESQAVINYGNLKGTPGEDEGVFKSGKRTAFTEFMNLLMHPDPKKRLSPQQALEHPFLRDSLLSEEQSRQIVLRSSTDTGAIPGQEEGRDSISHARSIKPGVEDLLNEITQALEGFDKVQVAPKDLLPTRNRFASFLTRLGSGQRMIRQAISALSSLIEGRVQTKHDVQTKDTEDHNTFQQFDQIIEAQRARVENALKRLEARVRQSTNTRDDEAPDIEALAGRLQQVRSDINELKGLATLTMNEKNPRTLERHQALSRVHTEIVALQARLANERKLLVGVVQKLSRSRSEKTVVDQVRDLSNSLRLEIEGLTQLDQQVQPLLDQSTQDVENVTNEVGEFERSLEEKETLYKNYLEKHAQVTSHYESLARAPRETVESAKLFEQARGEYQELTLQHQELVDSLRKALGDLSRQTESLRIKVGQATGQGLPNLPQQLSGLRSRIGKLVVELDKPVNK